MKEILISEYYKGIKSPILTMAVVLPVIIPIIFFANKLDIPPETVFNNLKYSYEKNRLFSLFSDFFGFYCFIYGIFIVIDTVVLFYIDRDCKNIFYTFVSYQNLFKILIAKFTFFLSFFALSHLLVFIVSLLVCKLLILFRPDYDMVIDFSSILLIFLVFFKIFIANLGSIALTWFIALITRNFIIVVPVCFLVGSLTNFIFLPFSNSVSFFGAFLVNRRDVFKSDLTAGIFNSLGLSKIDINSIIWFLVIVFLTWAISKKRPTIILKRNF